MSTLNNRIYDAALNHDLTHSAFRLYVILARLLEGRDPDRPLGVSVPEIKANLVGVRGKGMGEGPLREAVRVLEEAGLVMVFGPHRSMLSLHVSLLAAPNASKADKVLKRLPLEGQI